MRKLYEDIVERLNKVDFREIWPGFHPFEFALYNSEWIVLANEELPWNESFVGNTAIQYKGRYIAIWNVEDWENPNVDMDELTADLVHEMFHAYQMTLGEMRFPNDLQMLHYPEDVQNRVDKYMENRELAKALKEKDCSIRKQHLRSFCELRNQRAQRIGTNIKQEYLVETVEGMAEYAGTSALRMLNPQKYQSRINRYAAYLEELHMRQLDLRYIGYYSGACFLLLVKEIGHSIVHQIGIEEKSVFEVIYEDWPELEETTKNVMANYKETVETEQVEIGLTELQMRDIMSQLLEQKKADQRNRVDTFRKKELHKITGEFYICGYDPMNLFCIDGYLYCSTFMAVSDLKGKNEKRLFGESLLELIPGNYNRVSCYYTP